MNEEADTENVTEGEIDGPVTQIGGKDGKTRNRISGKVNGPVVQAGTIHGGISIQ